MRYMLLLLAFSAPQAVPDGPYVLLNGHIADGEWSRSLAVPLDTETELRLHKDERSLFLAVVFKGPRHTGIDLYVRTAERTSMLHVSSALGERVLQSGEWSQMQWGGNVWWAANSIGTTTEQGRVRTLAPDAFEFQMSRLDLGRDVALCLDLKRPGKRLPAGAPGDTTSRWLRLVLQ